MQGRERAYFFSLCPNTPVGGPGVLWVKAGSRTGFVGVRESRGHEAGLTQGPPAARRAGQPFSGFCSSSLQAPLEAPLLLGGGETAQCVRTWVRSPAPPIITSQEKCLLMKAGSLLPIQAEKHLPSPPHSPMPLLSDTVLLALSYLSPRRCPQPRLSHHPDTSVRAR